MNTYEGLTATSSKLQHWLVRPDFDKDVLGSLRDAIRREKGPVAIGLTELTPVDREAVTLLAISEVNGVELTGLQDFPRKLLV